MVPARAAAAAAGVPGDVACRSLLGADGWVVAAVVAAVVGAVVADTEAVPEQVAAMAADEQSSFHRATGIRGAACGERGSRIGRVSGTNLQLRSVQHNARARARPEVYMSVL